MYGVPLSCAHIFQALSLALGRNKLAEALVAGVGRPRLLQERPVFPARRRRSARLIHTEAALSGLLARPEGTTPTSGCRRRWMHSRMSPSGTGVKVILRGSLPGVGTVRRRRLPDVPAQDGRPAKIEAYHFGRFFALTGAHVDGMPPNIEPRQAKLHELWDSFFGATPCQAGWGPRRTAPAGRRHCHRLWRSRSGPGQRSHVCPAVCTALPAGTRGRSRCG